MAKELDFLAPPKNEGFTAGQWDTEIMILLCRVRLKVDSDCQRNAMQSNEALNA